MGEGSIRFQSRFSVVRLPFQLLERRTCFPFRVEIDPPPSAGWRCFVFEGTYNGKRDSKVVQRPEGLWIHPARGRLERRIRPHICRRTSRTELAPREPENQLRARTRAAREDFSGQSANRVAFVNYSVL